MTKIVFSEWTNPTDFERNELVFEKRNKAYGAYLLRKNYNKTLIRSLLITVFFLVSLFFIPKISQLWAKDGTVPLYTDSVIIIIPFDATPIEKVIKPKHDLKPNLVKGLSTNWKEISNLKLNVDTAVIKNDDHLSIGNPNGIDTMDGLFVDIGDLDSGNKIIPPQPETIERIVSIMPEYIGGENALFKYLRDNLEFPEEAREINKSGKVNIAFVVEKDGSITNLKILSCSELGVGFESEAIRVISQMPVWKPGIQDGRKVRVLFSIPINFKLY